MTREEAALILDPETSRDALLPYESQEERIAVCEEACRLGAAALREKEERENPKPLTLGELREVPFLEWIWINVLSPFEHEQKVSAYYRRHTSCGAALAAKTFWCGYPGLTFGFDYADYGKSWLAYHQKQKEASNER